MGWPLGITVLHFGFDFLASCLFSLRATLRALGINQRPRFAGHCNFQLTSAPTPVPKKHVSSVAQIFVDLWLMHYSMVWPSGIGIRSQLPAKAHQGSARIERYPAHF